MTTDHGTGVGRRGAVLLLGLAGLGLSSAALAADVPGGSGTRAVLEKGWPGPTRTFERRGDSDWFRVALTGGQNYAFSVNVTNISGSCARLNLRNPSGQVLKSASSYEGGDGGFEFRSAASRTLFVEFKECSPSGASYPASYPYGYRGSVAADARGDTTTKATIAVGGTANGINNSSNDADYFRTKLEQGKSYTLSAEINSASSIALVDPQGKVLASGCCGGGFNGVRVPATGTYYVVVLGDDDSAVGRYTLGLTTP